MSLFLPMNPQVIIHTNGVLLCRRLSAESNQDIFMQVSTVQPWKTEEKLKMGK